MVFLCRKCQYESKLDSLQYLVLLIFTWIQASSVHTYSDLSLIKKFFLRANSTYVNEIDTMQFRKNQYFLHTTHTY